MRFIRAALLGTAFLFVLVTALAAQQSAPPDWQAWSFLMGDWRGVGSGQPGEGSGGFTLKPDLQQHVLIRTNYANYPATKDQPAFRHDDLMIIYHETPISPASAIYFDSEGHVIHYAVQVNPAARSAVFLSDPATDSPRYRLTYIAKSSDTLAIKFEIAPPGHPDDFKTYIDATAKRTVK